MTTGTRPADHSVSINGRELHYVEYDSPAPGATPVVILHGLSSSWGAMRRIAEHLAPQFHVYALDQRGHGESEWARADGYDTDSYLGDLEQFVDGLGLDRFVLIGQSMGGHHTIGYTARHPERIICAIANDIPPSYDTGSPDYSDQFPGGGHRTFATVEDWIAPRRESSPLTPEWGHELAAREQLREVPGGWQPKHDPNAVMHWQPMDLWTEAREIERPLLIIRGGRSQVLTAQDLQDMDMRIPGARSVTLEKAGHSTYYDMEHEWLSVASAFLASHVEA
jgi:pimeloyl-ACP methyl ester carboxylesterase